MESKLPPFNTKKNTLNIFFNQNRFIFNIVDKNNSLNMKITKMQTICMTKKSHKTFAVVQNYCTREQWLFYYKVLVVIAYI